MKSVIGNWVGNVVSLTLKVGGIATAVTIEGKMLNVSEAGILLEMPKGQTFVPVASILHVSLVRED